MSKNQCKNTNNTKGHMAPREPGDPMAQEMNIQCT